jgi:hypothetical protein
MAIVKTLRQILTRGMNLDRVAALCIQDIFPPTGTDPILYTNVNLIRMPDLVRSLLVYTQWSCLLACISTAMQDKAP